MIKIDKLTRDFGTFRALDGLSLTVPPGIVFGFLGPNGAGKTTTIRMLLGLMAPTAGRAHVLGFDTQTQADQIRANTGALLEHSGVYEHMSAADNLEFYGRVYRMPGGQRQARIKEILTQMELWERRKEPVGKWSRGMKQRLALGRALLHRPPLVFLDEPTAGLDVIAASAVRENIAAMVARSGTTVFLTTHNMAEAEKLCSQVAVIRAGKLVALGSPAELMDQSGESRIEITGTGFTPELVNNLQTRSEVIWVKTCNGHLQLSLSKGSSLSPLVNLLVSAGVRIEEVHQGKTSLEQAFLDLMKEEV
jgi:ABC-2 type transport system ATP-binding protein